MGLDAYVPCDCYERGQVGEPPLDWSYLALQDGLIAVRDILGTPIDEIVRRDKILDGWMGMCCPHPGMVVCKTRVDNWSGVRLFTACVETVDDGSLTVLRSLMPGGNYGQVLPQEAARALAELDHLETIVNGQAITFLSDAETGEEVYSYIPAYRGAIHLASNYVCGFDSDGIFVERGGEVVFRSRTVRQRTVGVKSEKPIVEWAGGDGESIISEHIGIGHEDREWQVTSRPMDVTDIPCRQALRELCAASVQVGRPIYWT